MACWMRGRKRDLPCWKPLESNMEEIREVESHTSFKKRWSMKEIMREKNPGNALWKGLNKLKELSCRSFLCSSAFRDKKCWRTQPQCAGKDLSREGSQMWKFNSANTNHIDFPQQYSRQWLPKLNDFPYQSNRKKSNVVCKIKWSFFEVKIIFSNEFICHYKINRDYNCLSFFCFCQVKWYKCF